MKKYMIASSPNNPSYKQEMVKLTKMFNYALKCTPNSKDM